jgi:hypothetical protein
MATSARITGSATETGSTAKAALNHADIPIVRVQPPRLEDLQPSYAKVLMPDQNDIVGHG